MPKNQTSFKQGQSGNPGGRRKVSELERSLRDAPREEYLKAYQDIAGKSMADIRKIKDDESKPFILIAMAAAAISGITNGDWSRWDKVLDRIEGKAIFRQEISGQDGEPIEMIWPDLPTKDTKQ